MPSLGEWLASLGLSEYADRFAKHRIDFSILQNLTDKDLKEELGIVLLGDRRRLLRAIAKLAGTASATPQLAAGSEPSPRDEAERRHLTMMICDLVGSTDWHSATDRILMANGRFRGEADVHGRVASVTSVVSFQRVLARFLASRSNLRND